MIVCKSFFTHFQDLFQEIWCPRAVSHLFIFLVLNLNESLTTCLQSDVVYQCRRFPDYRHCGQAGYRPPKSPATPGAWKDAWTPQGICDPNHAEPPTSSPSFDLLDVDEEGCPEVWQSSTSYYGGDLVSVTVSDVPMRRIVYQCRGYPYEGYCNQEAFQPDTVYGHIS